MAKRIGQISASVSANAAGFTRGMRTAKAEALSFAAVATRAMRGTGAAIGGILNKTALAAGAAAAGAGIAVGIMVKNSFESVDKLAKTADAIGITTEALAGLRHGADLAGVGNDLLDSSLVRMTRTIAQAAQGSGTAVRAMDQLGLSAARMLDLTPDAQIKAIADRLMMIESPTMRAALAMDIFGKQGAKMINVLAGGAAGLASAQAEAEALGLTISRIDAAKIEVANDSVTRLKAVLAGAAQTLAVDLAPWISGIAQRLTAAGIGADGFAAKLVSGVRFAAKGVAMLWDVVDLGRIAWAGVQAVGARAIQGLLYPVQSLLETINAVVMVAADYLPDAIVKASQAAEDGIVKARLGLDRFAAEKSKQIDEMLVSESATERVDRFFRESEAAAMAEAQTIADAAAMKLAAQQEYNGAVAESIALAEDESNAVAKVKKPEKKRQATEERADLKLLVAGTADAQAFVFDQSAKRAERIQTDLLEEAQAQTTVLEDIRDEVEDDDLVPVAL